jgi:Bacterial Ig-like domain (group 2)
LPAQTFHRHDMWSGSARWSEEMHNLKLGHILMIAALVTACGDKPNPVGPSSPPAPAVASLVISGADYVLTGSSTTYTATATLSDGSTRTVTPSWSSSAVNVATVDNAGRLDGRAHGSTTLTAAHDGRSASQTVQVVNNYGGSWSGRYTIRACKDSGIFTDGIFGGSDADVPWCQVLIGSARPFAVTLVQTGRNFGEIRATFSPNHDWASGTISGIVTADGRLSLEGTLKVLDWYFSSSWDLQLSGWDTNLDGFSGMTGRWAQNYTIPGQQERGSAYEEVELVTMSRTATAATSR